MARFLDTRGKWNLAVAICTRCGFKMAHADMGKDPNTGQRMHPHCVDAFDPYRLPQRAPDRIALPFVLPDRPLTFTESAAVETPAPEPEAVIAFASGLNEASLDAMMGDYPTLWQSALVSDDYLTNEVSRQTALAPEGAAYVQCYAEPKTLSAASQACLQRNFPVEILPGHTIAYSMLMKLVAPPANLTDLYVLAIETNGLIALDPPSANDFGLRLKFNATGTFRLDRSGFGLPNLNDAEGRLDGVPADTWFRLDAAIVCADDATGSVTLSVDGTEVFRQTNIQTMPDSVTLPSLIAPVYHGFKTGIVSNANINDGFVVQIDDVRFVVT